MFKTVECSIDRTKYDVGACFTLNSLVFRSYAKPLLTRLLRQNVMLFIWRCSWLLCKRLHSFIFLSLHQWVVKLILGQKLQLEVLICRESWFCNTSRKINLQTFLLYFLLHGHVLTFKYLVSNGLVTVVLVQR